VENIVSSDGRIPAKNGGWLTPGNAGNKGGTGRPKDEVRAMLQENLEKAAVKIAAKLDSDEDLSIDQLVKIQDGSGKYSIGTKNEVTLNNAQLVDVIFRAFGDEFDKLGLFTDEEARKELFERVALVADGVK